MYSTTYKRQESGDPALCPWKEECPSICTPVWPCPWRRYVSCVDGRKNSSESVQRRKSKSIGTHSFVYGKNTPVSKGTTPLFPCSWEKEHKHPCPWKVECPGIWEEINPYIHGRENICASSLSLEIRIMCQICLRSALEMWLMDQTHVLSVLGMKALV